jgi:tetratricopeptide (TPR) repeat protein
MIQAKGGGSLISKISSYLQIVSKDPHSTAFVPLAEAYRQIGLLEDALEAARLGTNMLPNFSPGFATLGRILGQMGRIDEAMSAYTTALSIDRQVQSALVGLARLHLVRGEREEARKILREAAEYHPQDEMIENMLIALDLPRPWDKPLPVPEAAPAPPTVVPTVAAPSDGEPIPTATLAEIYAKQGLISQAIHVYQEILRLEPDNAVANRRLQELSAPAAVTATFSGEPSVEVSSPPSPQRPRQPLAVFERWLQAIQVRRAHVS